MKKQNLAKEFIPEIINILEAFEEGLLELEKTGDEASPDLINRVFRAIHSIKGSASFCDFESLKQVSHAMENVLMQVRDGSMKLNSGIIDVLLSGVDCIHMMVKESGSYVETSCDDEISNLDDLLKTFVNKSAPPPGAKPSGAARKRGGRHGGAPSADHADGMMLKVDGGDGDGPHYFNIGKDSLDAGLSDNMYLFAIRVFHDEDLEKKGRTIRDFVAEIEASGKCLASDIGGKKPRDEESREERPDIHHFLVGTIFPFELLREVLQISGEQILLIEKPVFESKTAPETTSPASEPDVAPGAVAPAPGKTPPEQIAPPPAPTTIRLGVDLVDNLMNLAGELVLGRNQLRQAIEEFITANPRIAPVMKHVDRITSETQEDIMRMRMQPVGNILNKLPRIARDMSRVLTKKVNLTIEGGNVELDKSILEGLSNPMTHLIRNCVDHGIELPGERINSGKPETGAIHVKVFHEGGRVNIIINDDGRGIDAGQIVEKAVGKKLVDRTHANRMKEKEKLNLIFLPGFSTAENITDISGRGVGMDVVKTGVEKLGGHLDVATEIGKGTTVQLTIPLTLAIIPSLIVGAGNLRFAIPQVNVKELIRIPAGDISRKIEKIGGSDVVRARGGLLPLLRLADVLSLNSSYTHPRTGEVNNDRRLDFAGRRRNAPDSFQTGEEDAAPAGPPDNRRRDADRRVNWRNDINVVVLWVGANVFGLCVEELFDHEEIVVKPLSKHIKDCKCFSGATIMGDGRVAMILDAAGIASHSRLRFGEINDEEDRRRAEERRGSRKKELKSILLFNCAPDERFAMPLSGVSRLELIAPRTIERIGDQEFIAYRGEGLPLIRLEKFLPVRPLPEKPGELYVIIPKTTRASMGILASRIVDAIDAEVFIRKNAGPVSGLLESAIVEDRLMFFLDADGLLKLIEERQSLYTRPEAMGNR